MKKLSNILAFTALFVGIYMLTFFYARIYVLDLEYLHRIGASGFELAEVDFVYISAAIGIFALLEICLSLRYLFFADSKYRTLSKTVAWSISLLLSEIVLIGQAMSIRTSLIMGKSADAATEGILMIFSALAALLLIFIIIIVNTFSVVFYRKKRKMLEQGK